MKTPLISAFLVGAVILPLGAFANGLGAVAGNSAAAEELTSDEGDALAKKAAEPGRAWVVFTPYYGEQADEIRLARNCVLANGMLARRLEYLLNPVGRRGRAQTRQDRDPRPSDHQPQASVEWLAGLCVSEKGHSPEGPQYALRMGAGDSQEEAAEMLKKKCATLGTDASVVNDVGDNTRLVGSNFYAVGICRYTPAPVKP